jgi:putative transposase
MTDEMTSLSRASGEGPDADVLHEMIGFAAERLMEMEIGTLAGAPYGEESRPAGAAQRLSRAGVGDADRNGRAAYPEALQGQLISRLSRAEAVAEKALTAVKSQVSRLCEEIDGKVKAFLDRPIEGDWPYLWIDATYVKARENGRIVSAAVIVAVGVNSDGRRQVFGMETSAPQRPRPSGPSFCERVRHVMPTTEPDVFSKQSRPMGYRRESGDNNRSEHPTKPSEYYGEKILPRSELV